MAKPQLVKVEALFYVLQQITKRDCAYFDTAPYHIVGVSGGGKWAASGYFFTAKHFVIKKNLLTLHLEKMLYNIVIQHKTMGNIIACDNTNDKNT